MFTACGFPEKIHFGTNACSLKGAILTIDSVEIVERQALFVVTLDSKSYNRFLNGIKKSKQARAMISRLHKLS